MFANFFSKPINRPSFSHAQPFSALPSKIQASQSFDFLRARHLSSQFKPTYSFAKPNFLERHFKKHQLEFAGAYYSPQEYLEGARNVIAHGTKAFYQYKGENRIGYFKIFMIDPKTQLEKYEFVGTNHKGQIATYHIRNKQKLTKLLKSNPIKTKVSDLGHFSKRSPSRKEKTEEAMTNRSSYKKN